MTTSDSPVIISTSVSKHFGEVVAVDQVDLTVRPREVLVLLGLSGSGKSTLLRCLNGLHPVTDGEVEVLGLPVHRASRAELRQLRTRIGFVFQQFNLVGRLTCLENVVNGALGRIRGPRYGLATWSRQLKDEAREHLDRVGLADQALQRADTLSGGQQQRVAIARMLMQRPEVVLADEPVASLDPENAEAVMSLLVQICAEQGLTVICSLHQIDLALRWGHRIVGLRNGSKVLDRATAGLSKDEAMQIYRQVSLASAA